MSPHSALETLLDQLRTWWLSGPGLGDRKELDRMAQDLGMSANDLQDIVARGPDAANLLFERMRVLGITKADVERSAEFLMHDLERTCSLCKGKRVCSHDLASAPADPNWKNYCPNATTLEALARATSEHAA
jgi:hypothetical protein